MSRRLSRALAVLALLVGCVAGFAASLRLFMVDDTCPQFESEGPMAARSSPYSTLLCGPADPPLVWAAYAGFLLALALAVALLVRPPVRRAAGVALLTLVLVLPALTIAALHVSLPRDCLSGERDTFGCFRDRELR